MKHLAVGLRIGVVAVGAAAAGEAQVCGDLLEVLRKDQGCGDGAEKGH